MTGKQVEKRNHIDLKYKVNQATPCDFLPLLKRSGQYFETEMRKQVMFQLFFFIALKEVNYLPCLLKTQGRDCCIVVSLLKHLR